MYVSGISEGDSEYVLPGASKDEAAEALQAAGFIFDYEGRVVSEKAL